MTSVVGSSSICASWLESVTFIAVLAGAGVVGEVVPGGLLEFVTTIAGVGAAVGAVDAPMPAGEAFAPKLGALESD